MIGQVQPRLMITTGTAGGIGAATLLGDVIVSSRVRWDATTRFADQPWAHAAYISNGTPPWRPSHQRSPAAIPFGDHQGRYAVPSIGLRIPNFESYLLGSVGMFQHRKSAGRDSR